MSITAFTLLLLSQASDVTESEPAWPRFRFERHTEDVVVPLGKAGEWDSSTMWDPRVLVVDGKYHMFYSGNDSGDPAAPFKSPQGLALGLATSEDGVNWIKSPSNPVVRHRGDTPTSICAVYHARGQWTLLYNVPDQGFGAQGTVYRATAKDPEGPWTQHPEPALVGPENSWFRRILPFTILAADGGYRTYFTGFDQLRTRSHFGLATSPDLEGWTFHPEPILSLLWKSLARPKRRAGARGRGTG